MAILAHKEIENRIFRKKNSEDQLILTPLLDIGQITANGVDVRLGSEFIVIKQTNLTSVDPARRREFEENIGRYQERVRVRFGEKFVLHPGQLVLGSTLEYIGMPTNLTAQVVGRSSWGRLGLIIATAPVIASGFRGVITLELINNGQAPLDLRPGYGIAQLVFQKTTSRVPYTGRYKCPTSPEFTKLLSDPDIAFWSDKALFDYGESLTTRRRSEE